jgi:tetratricopeptide (TPR) repeat protein
VVNTLIEQQGAAILDDSKRMGALLKDLAPEEPRMEIIALVKCLEYNFHLNLKNIDDIHDRAQRKNQLVDQLYNNEGLDQRLCASGLELLEKVLFPRPPVSGDDYKQEGEFDAEINDFNAVLSVDPDYIDELLYSGDEYLWDEEYDLAIRNYSALS